MTEKIIIRNDEETSDDRLKRNQYAEAFAKLAEACETPLVIGLYGGWGVGKSSLMKLIQKNLNKEKTLTVWFDPWQHQFNEFPVISLLHAAATAASKEENIIMDAKQRSDIWRTLIVATAAIVTNISPVDWNNIDAIGERYEKERFQVLEEKTRLRKHFENLIELWQENKTRRLVFFIDDLDRCMPNTVLSLLEALKLYMNFPGCVYFLGVDPQILENSIKHHYKDVQITETSYLDKIVQLPFTIPPIMVETMQDFIEPLLTEGLRPCLDILKEGLDYNPRQVKRFINVLMLNHQLASDIDGYNARVLALLLLIQYRNLALYKRIINRPKFLSELKEDKKSQDENLSGQEQLKRALSLINISEISEEEKLLKYIHLTQLTQITKDTAKIKRPRKNTLSSLLKIIGEKDEVSLIEIGKKVKEELETKRKEAEWKKAAEEREEEQERISNQIPRIHGGD